MYIYILYVSDCDAHITPNNHNVEKLSHYEMRKCKMAENVFRAGAFSASRVHSVIEQRERNVNITLVPAAGHT